MTLNSNQQGSINNTTNVFEADNSALAASQANLTAANTQIADLTKQLADCQNPPPPPQTGQLMGSSVNGPLFQATGLNYDTVAITRVYLRDLPPGSNWDSVLSFKDASPEAVMAAPRSRPSLQSIPGDAGAATDLRDGVRFATDVLWISWKEQDPSLVDAFLDTMPDDLGVEVWGTFHHEPENDAPGYSPATFVSQFRAQAPVVRAHNVKFATILMRYTFSPGSGRDWHDWWPGAQFVDIFGCDSYNTGNKKGVYSNPVSQLQPICDAAASVGDKPVAIGETGASIFNAKPAPRAAWAKGLRQAGVDLGVLGMAWWDQDSYTFDQATAEVWLG